MMNHCRRAIGSPFQGLELVPQEEGEDEQRLECPALRSVLPLTPPPEGDYLLLQSPAPEGDNPLLQLPPPKGPLMRCPAPPRDAKPALPGDTKHAPPGDTKPAPPGDAKSPLPRDACSSQSVDSCLSLPRVGYLDCDVLCPAPLPDLSKEIGPLMSCRSTQL
ncbi:UNVERIFIED_CONTAM: hypothetical protein FKN15_066739 [Acipenser sinensis]